VPLGVKEEVQKSVAQAKQAVDSQLEQLKSHVAGQIAEMQAEWKSAHQGLSKEVERVSVSPAKTVQEVTQLRNSWAMVLLPQPLLLLFPRLCSVPCPR